MLDAATVYPMMRTRRRRLRRRVTGVQARMAVVLAALAMLLVGGAWWLTRTAPADPRRLLAQSLGALAAGNYNAARDNAQKAVARAPRTAMAHAVLARAYLELDDGLAAEAALSRAVTAGLPPARLQQLFAHARLLQGDPAGAIDRAARAAPRYAGYAARIAARAEAAAGRRIAAGEALRALVAATPRDGEAWTDLARLRLAGGDLGGAAAAAGQAARLLPGSPRTLTLAGEVVRARYGLVAALPWFAAALRRDPYYHPALIEQAATLGEAGRNADMLAALRRAMAARPGSAQAFYLQAVLAARAGRSALAGALLARGGGVPGARLLGGALDYDAGHYQQAAATWQGLADAQPMNLPLRRLLAAALLRSGDAPGALAVLRPLVVRRDADGEALMLAARGLEAIGDRAAAASLLDRAARAAPGASTAFATDHALATLAADARRAPADPTYAVGLIRGLVTRGDRAAVMAAAGALAVAGPGAPAAQTAHGDVLALAGRDPRAAYARAADLRFDEPAMLRLVDAEARGGRPARASAVLALYVSQNPQSLIAQRMLGRLQRRAGAWDAAIETLEGVRRRGGDRDAALLADLALAYAGAGDGAVATRYAAAAYRLQPMNAAVVDAYARALAVAGRDGEARQLLDKARALAGAG